MPGKTRIHYADIGDYLTREQKLQAIQDQGSFKGLHAVDLIAPNEQGDWLAQRSDDFDLFVPVGAKHGSGASGITIFELYGRGLETGRDAWIYHSSGDALHRSIQKTIGAFNSQVEGFEKYLKSKTERAKKLVGTFIDLDSRKISWTLSLKNRLAARRRLEWQPAAVVMAVYRPFMRQLTYADRGLIHIVGQAPAFFPTQQHGNLGFYQVGSGSAVPFSVLMLDALPDLHVTGAGSGGQFFARWRYEVVVADDRMLSLESREDIEVIDGYRRIDNITDHALVRFQAAYGEWITKDDIFFYVYGLLHSPDYRETYVADLKKMLPRIPLVTDARPFIDAGRALGDLHLGYESVTPYPLDGLPMNEAFAGATDDAAYQRFRVEKMAFAKVRDPETNKLVADRSTIIYNSRITLRGIPEGAYRYMLGSRSAIEWIMDRYRVKTDKPSGIVNDPNDWSHEVEDPRYIVDLLARIVTVSLDTMKIVDSLPALDIRDDQGGTA